MAIMLQASRWTRGVALAAVAVSTTGCPLRRPYETDGVAGGYEVSEPEWGFGLTPLDPLLEFRRYAVQQVPDWCHRPDTLLEELKRAILSGGSDLGRRCNARLEDSFAAGRILEVVCPLTEGTATCRDTYIGMVWGNRYDDRPADYDLYGFGWVRRACKGSSGDFFPPDVVWEAAERSSMALQQFLDQCRRRNTGRTHEFER